MLAFRCEGSSPEAQSLLSAAFQANRFVPRYLLGKEPLPPLPPPMYRIGGEAEAEVYAFSSLDVWGSTPGALAWLRSRSKQERKQGRARKKRRR
jgi:hypothetical protein